MSRPRRWAISRTRRTVAVCSAALPCEKFTLTTLVPAASMRSRVSGLLEAGPRVATILVARIMGTFLGEGSGRRRRLGAGLERRHRRQRAALEEFEEGAATGRDVADLVGDAVLGDRGQRVTAAGN